MRNNLIKKLAYISITFFSLFVTLTHCAKSYQNESFAPSTAQATISAITANGGGSLYCSISGGCPLNVTGADFYPGARIYIGPYECLNMVISPDHTQVNCVVAPGKSGVFDISIVNKDGKASVYATGVNPTALKFSYASFLYLGVQEAPIGKVYAYAQNPATGALLPITGSPFSIAAGASNTYGAAMSPNNKFLYAANVSSNSISIFSINSVTGALTAVGAPVATVSGANGLYFHPSGNFLYVSSFNTSAMGGYSVAADGTLTAIPGSPFSTGTATIMNGVVVHSSGNYLYSASMGGTGGVVGFSIDSVTGALTLLPGSPFKNNTGGFNNTGDGITIHPNRRWLYMGLVNVKRAVAFNIDVNTGLLTGIGTPILNNATTGYTDNGGSGASISPDGLFFYGTAFSTNVADPKKVIIYNIDQITGDLARASEADAGGGPNDIRIDTNGVFAYTCNSMNSPSVSAFTRNAVTGALTPLTPRDVTIPTANGGPGIMVIQK